MRPFTERSAKPRRQANTRLAEFVAQPVSCGQRVFPALLAIAFEQVDLLRLRCKRRSLYTQQPDLRAFLPVLTEERPDLFKDFIVELRRTRQGMRARDRSEILVAQFQLNCPRVEMRFP